jgi:predicted ATPase
MLKRVHIRNFRSFRDFAIDLGVNNVIVGANNSGKSNLADFFKFVKDLLIPSQSGMYGIYSALNTRNGFTEIAWRGSEIPLTSFALEGAFKDSTSGMVEWSYSVEIAGNFQFNSAIIQKEQLLTRSADGERELIRTEGNKRLVVGATGQPIAEASDSTRLALESNYQDWPGNTIRILILSWRLYNLIPPLMKQLNPTAAPYALNVFGDNLSAWLMLLQTRYAESFARIKTAALDAFPGVLDFFCTPTEQSKVYVSSEERGLLRPIGAPAMSDGELAFLALLSLIYAPPELGADLYLVEEPENHLHPRLLSNLIDLLRQVQAELGDGVGQILVTTHSLHLIDKFSLDEMIILRKENGATVASRPRDTKDLREMLESKEVGLGDLYYSGALNIA